MPPLPHSALLLAASTEPARSGFSNSELGIWLLIAFALIAGADKATSLWQRFRRPRALESEFVSREEHAKHCDQLRHELTRIEERLEGSRHEREAAFAALQSELQRSTSTISTMMQDISRAIGRLEGAQDLAKQLAEALRQRAA